MPKPAPVNDEVPWTQKHVCGVCGAKWVCFLTMCWEPEITTCKKCKCGPLVCGWRDDFQLKP